MINIKQQFLNIYIYDEQFLNILVSRDVSIKQQLLNVSLIDLEEIFIPFKILIRGVLLISGIYIGQII